MNINELDAQLSIAILQAWWGYPRIILIALEWLIHGIPWLICTTFTFIYVCRWNYSKKVQYRCALLLFSIIFDLIIVGVIKIAIRRPRPAYNRNDQVFEAPIADKYSFPSGHTTRASMFAILFVELFDVESTFIKMLIHSFPVILGFSRIALGRHYLSDIIAGFFIGSIEALLVLQLPVDFYLHITHYIPIVFKS